MSCIGNVIVANFDMSFYKGFLSRCAQKVVIFRIRLKGCLIFWVTIKIIKIYFTYRSCQFIFFASHQRRKRDHESTAHNSCSLYAPPTKKEHKVASKGVWRKKSGLSDSSADTGTDIRHCCFCHWIGTLSLFQKFEHGSFWSGNEWVIPLYVFVLNI